jgi:hypothetical protein
LLSLSVFAAVLIPQPLTDFPFPEYGEGKVGELAAGEEPLTPQGEEAGSEDITGVRR